MVLIIFVFLLSFINNTLIIPFKNSKFGKTNLSLNEIITNQIFSEIKIGNPEQNIKTQLTFLTHYIFILKDNYNILNSNTYLKIENNEKRYSSKGMDIKGYLSKESLNIQNNKITNFSFIYIENTTIQNSDSKLNNSLLGLRPKPKSFEDHPNLINQLKQNNLISSYIYTLNYKTEYECELIIGKYPHEYNTKYKDNNLKIISSEIFAERFDWYINFHNITYGNESDFTHGVEFSLDYFGIIGTNQYKKKIDKIFFNDLFNKGLCYNETISYGGSNINFLYVYICNKDIDIGNFNNLVFYNHELNMSFIFGSDLFKEFNGKKYFMVFFPFYSINRWIFGEIFFMKYKAVFDQLKGTIGFYEEVKIQINFPFTTFTIVCLLIAVIILSWLLFKNITKKRKLRANELDDNYEYLPDNNLYIKIKY